MSVQIGLQLYSVRNSLAADPWGTLEAVADAGFKYLEVANHNADTDPGVGFGVSAAEMRNKLADLGMSVVGAHIHPLELDILPQALEYQAELGNTQFGVGIDFFPYGDHDFVLKRAAEYNSIGELARQYGLRFYFHNHFHEFQYFGDKPVFQLLLENTDPELVKFELDTYWTYRGGQDPVEWIKRYSDRIVLLHQKDFPKDAKRPLNLFDGVVGTDESIDMERFRAANDHSEFVEIGTGILPIQDIIDTAAALPQLQYLILEQDYTQLDELDSIRTSYQAFKDNFTGIRFD